MNAKVVVTQIIQRTSLFSTKGPPVLALNVRVSITEAPWLSYFNSVHNYDLTIEYYFACDSVNWSILRSWELSRFQTALLHFVNLALVGSRFCIMPCLNWTVLQFLPKMFQDCLHLAFPIAFHHCHYCDSPNWLLRVDMFNLLPSHMDCCSRSQRWANGRVSQCRQNAAHQLRTYSRK